MQPVRDGDGTLACEVAVVGLKRHILRGVFKAIAAIANQFEIGNVLYTELFFGQFRHISVQLLIISDAMSSSETWIVLLD